MTSPKNYAWLLGTILLSFALIVATAYLLSNEPPTTTVEILPPLPTPSALPTETPAPIKIYIVGEVQNPDTYILPPNSRVEDAIEAAGGITERANLNAINLAEILQDGVRIAVPSLVEEENVVLEPTSIVPTKININTATLEELDTLSGIGPATAQAIIDYREENGPFETLEELLEVPNIGQRTLESLELLITVE